MWGGARESVLKYLCMKLIISFISGFISAQEIVVTDIIGIHAACRQIHTCSGGKSSKLWQTKEPFMYLGL